MSELSAKMISIKPECPPNLPNLPYIVNALKPSGAYSVTLNGILFSTGRIPIPNLQQMYPQLFDLEIKNKQTIRSIEDDWEISQDVKNE